MRGFYHQDQALHEPKQFMRYGEIAKPTDSPLRTQKLLIALENLGVSVETPQDYSRLAALKVHPNYYLDYLETAYSRWLELPMHGVEVLPNSFPYWNGDPAKDRRPPCPSNHLIAQSGYYLGDLAVPISKFTYLSVLRSTHSATAAAEAILEGEKVAYALCRPSGHHCRSDRASGFCYMNNAAIAAEHLRQEFKKIAVLDIDAHHGDGTQEIFYRRSDILTVSVHVDTSVYYPFYTGYQHEKGYGEGLGYNVNIPIAANSDDESFLTGVGLGVDYVKNYGAEVVVLALGYDTHKDDPLSIVKVTTDAFHKAAILVARLGIPVVIIQEGGYQVSVIGDCLKAFLTGILAKI
ncbi:histone deacetylase family protein [Bartonella sp. HY038]|uniref:histone deacetylase family protein n=1 Tax=Bartonella sp. HY038 TaxID=2759660 RepID=UPI0015FDE021|nr:histone deacetylase family protein [Bartonella sp. HY038]